MKIEGPRGVGQASGGKKAAGATAPGFAVAAEGASRASAASGVSALHALDAVLALQGGVNPDKRGRQVRRGKEALDALQDIEKALVMGGSPEEMRAALEEAARRAEPTGEPELDSVLAEIDIRVAVELAKLDMAQERMKQRGLGGASA
jgi:hypothetical protein